MFSGFALLCFSRQHDEIDSPVSSAPLLGRVVGDRSEFGIAGCGYFVWIDVKTSQQIFKAICCA